MLDELGRLYRSSGRYALACPLLFAVPILAEAMQHVAEYGQGFYASIAAAKATEHSILRMGFGTAKVLSLLIARYWVVRWLEWGDPSRTRGFDRRSIATFLPFLVLELALALPAIWIPVFAQWLTKPLLLLSLLVFPFDLLLSDWSRTAATGARGGPLQSIRIVAPAFLWALGFTLVAIVPPMVVHYGLGIGAMKASGLLQIVALAVDTIFVGYLGAVIAGAPWFISERARHRAEAAMGSGDVTRLHPVA